MIEGGERGEKIDTRIRILSLLEQRSDKRAYFGLSVKYLLSHEQGTSDHNYKENKAIEIYKTKLGNAFNISPFLLFFNC